MGVVHIEDSFTNDSLNNAPHRRQTGVPVDVAGGILCGCVSRSVISKCVPCHLAVNKQKEAAFSKQGGLVKTARVWP